MSWASVRIDECVTSAIAGFACGESDRDGVAQIRMNNVAVDGTLNFDKVRYVPRSAAKIEKFLLADGDVLFNATNSANLVGKTALVANLPEPFVFSNHFIRIRTNPEKLEPSYFARWLTAQQQAGRFELMCNQWVNQASVRREDLLALNLPLPPLPEQRRIAAILDKADALRAKRREAIAKLDQLLQSVFLDMFGDPVSNIKGWRVKSLDDVAVELKRGPFGGALKKEIFVPSGYCVYEQQHAIEGDFGSVRYFIDADKYREMQGFSVLPSDLIVSCSGTMGKVAIVPSDARPGVINQALLKITPNSAVLKGEVLADILRSDRMQAHLFGISRGSGLKNFPPMADLRKLQIICPPSDLQEKYLELKSKLLAMRQKFTASGLDRMFAALQQSAFSTGLEI